MKYIIIEKRVEQVWYVDNEAVIMNKDLMYIPYDSKSEAETWISEAMYRDIINLQGKVIANDYLDCTVEFPEFNMENCIKYGNYMPYAYDKTEEEYEEVYYIRVSVKEEKTIFEEA